MKNIVKIGLISLIGLVITQCEVNEDNVQVIPEIVSIIPENGTIDISVDSSVQIEFSEPMNVESCESRFQLTAANMSEMYDSDDMMGDNMMNDDSMDSNMVTINGSFTWDEEQMTMTFHPDSMLMSSTMHTIWLGEGMETHNHGDNMVLSGMQNQGNFIENGIESIFTTK